MNSSSTSIPCYAQELPLWERPPQLCAFTGHQLPPSRARGRRHARALHGGIPREGTIARASVMAWFLTWLPARGFRPSWRLMLTSFAGSFRPYQPKTFFLTVVARRATVAARIWSPPPPTPPTGRRWNNTMRHKFVGHGNQRGFLASEVEDFGCSRWIAGEGLEDSFRKPVFDELI
jgi:hypothetical protein